MKEHYTNFQLQAPYYTLNELTPHTKTIWLVCHGYGQLARFFLRKFSVLDKAENYFIFPQGLSKFYMNNHTIVGASWMTKEDRITDIKNQYAYFDSVLYNELGTEVGKYQLNLFGFSQGVATITRYAVYKKMLFNKLILWAGGLPTELKEDDFLFLEKGMEIDILLGDSDKYYTIDEYQIQVDRAKELMGDAVRFTIFNGDHEIKVEELLKL